MKRSTSKNLEKMSKPTPKRTNEVNVYKEIEKEKISLIVNTGNKMQNLTKPISIKQSCSKCTECFKWEIRLQEQIKIVRLLTEETINLHKERKAVEREKTAWKSLYEMYKII